MLPSWQKKNSSPALRIARIAVLVTESSPISFMLEKALSSSSSEFVRFNSVGQLENWVQRNLPALVIMPLSLRTDFVQAVPAVKFALRKKEDPNLKFLAISDLEDRVRSIPAAQSTIRMLQGLMEFVPTSTDSAALAVLIEKSLKQIEDRFLENSKVKKFYFLKGKELPQNYQELLESYSQGILALKRLIQVSDCTLLAMDSSNKQYRVVNSSRPELNDGYWDFSFANIIPNRDIISSKGYYYFKPVKSCISADAEELTHGFIYVSRENSRRPLNSDEVQLMGALALELEGVSENFTSNRHPEVVD